ncbi:phage tail sheath family protein [Pseudoxanthomonas yeongjuensis]|uniref:phage tail sheath family protein n=1 Tax=Pseudoxanthomonas yeongjuensis TaxID=377616 RepID=UPI0013908BEE|nr:phage tail sheath subtilisin-like domain-containing protein [Pseudoxanthomonas yeongjuensis]
MPEYPSPGVYAEEIAYRARSIEASSTDLTLFVGALPGDPDPAPRVVTGWQEFVDAWGSSSRIDLAGVTSPNYLAYAAHAYFQNGGRKLCVVPVGGMGGEPQASDYAAALASSLGLADISLVHAPGASTWAQREPIEDVLVAHAGHEPGRFLVLDPPAAQDLAQVRAQRARLDTSHAALYYPWIVANDVLATTGAASITLPPGGFLCGIHVRTAIEQGIHKPPANSAIRGALDFETRLSELQQDVLNPEGINCLRAFDGRGLRVWGARTMGSDPEWKYINIRRYSDYLQRSLERGTRWAAFERNDETLWSNLRAVIQDFLHDEWRNGALLGSKPEQAWFVSCDRSTMTQEDIDQGRLVCLVGVALLKPAEFAIFRLSQPTADTAG